MRVSKRDAILQTAVALIEEQGIEAVTYENLAKSSGLSKSGLVYHFPSRHELLRSIHEHMARAWEEKLVATAGGTASELTTAERLRAVVKVMGNAAPRAQLLMVLDASSHPDFTQPWAEADQNWLPSPHEITQSGLASAAYLVQLLADGIWVHDHLHHDALAPEARNILIDSILALIPQTSRPADQLSE